MENEPKVEWSVWDKSSVVKWKWGKQFARVKFRLPPIGVCALKSNNIMAVLINPEESDKNLVLYLPSGEYIKSYAAPDLGRYCHYGYISELDGGKTIEATVCYQDNNIWLDKKGIFNLETGELSNIHRSY